MENKSKRFCSPSKGKDSYTCYTFDNLVKIAKIWNKNNNEDISSKLFVPSEKYNLWKILKEKMKTISPCEEEYCWLKSNILKNVDDIDIKYETFIPEKPKKWNKNPIAWLSTTDIQHVLLQYEGKFPELEFFGPVPIDFDSVINGERCVDPDLCKINLENLYKKGKRVIGIVFNLDPHYKGGSHWVSMYISLYNGGIYYFDSAGKFPVAQIVNLMTKLRNQGNLLIKNNIIDFNSMHSDHSIICNVLGTENNEIKIDDVKPFYKNMSFKVLDNNDDKLYYIKDVINKKIITDNPISSVSKKIIIKGFRLFYNDIKHQKGNTECGVYSINFIKTLLHGKTYEDYTRSIQDDNKMVERRDEYYRPTIKPK